MFSRLRYALLSTTLILPTHLPLLAGDPQQLTPAVERNQQFVVLLKRIDSLIPEENALWKNPSADIAALQRVRQDLNSALKAACKEAGENPDAWLALAKRADDVWIDQDTSIGIAETAVRLRPNAETLLLLGQSLMSKYMGDKTETGRAGLKRATVVLRSAVQLSASKDPEILYELGECLLFQYDINEAEAQYRLASSLIKPGNDQDLKKRIAEGLIMTAFLSGDNALMQARFSEFVDAGFAKSYDWAQEAWHLQNLKKYAESGETYLKAASLFKSWTFVCDAAESFYFGGDTDKTLSNARDCIEQGEGKDHSQQLIASARYQMADALNKRGIFSEALLQITQALAIRPNDPFFLDTESGSLYGAGRYQDAITASNAAIRASDGKYGWMHFQLGLAYFKLKNWNSAKESFERAANLEPSNAAAAYNVAASLQNAGFRRDAVARYKQVIVRDANYANKNDVLGSIADLEEQLR